MSRLATSLLAVAMMLLLWGPAALAQPAPSPGDPDAAARQHFERAEGYRDKEEWREALREYRQSLALKKTKGAMASAAVCLRALGQYDEALDQYEELRREFPVLPAAMESKVAPGVAELQNLVGTLAVTNDALSGASLFVDERKRGTLPQTAPLRLSVGSHAVRVEKEGFEPIAAGVVIKPTEQTAVRLEPASPQGRLRVTEKHNLSLGVELDGTVVGTTPWEGIVAAGDHAVRVHGFVRLDAEEDANAVAVASVDAPGRALDRTEMGSDRSTVAVWLYEVSAVTPSARDLDTSLRVDATPADASVAIDGRVVARGTWEGRLPLGVHTVEVTASGYLRATRDVRLERRKQPELHIDLSHAPRLGTWGPKRSVPVGVAYALGAAGITASAITGAAALVTVNQVRSHCASLLCPDSQASSADRANALATASTATLVVGAAGLVAGTALVVWYRPYDPQPGQDERQTRKTPAVAWSAKLGIDRLVIEGVF